MTKDKDTGRMETLYYAILLGSSKIIAYLVLLVLANWFVLSDYGRASFVMSAFRVAILCGSVGLPFIYVPWMINKKDTSSVFYFLLFFNILIMFIGLAIGIKHSWTWPIIFAIPLTTISGICNAILRVKHKYHIIQLMGIILEIYTLGFIAFLAVYGKAGIIWSHAIAITLTNFTFIYLTRKELMAIVKRFKFNLGIIKQYVSKGTITSLLYISGSILMWIDSLVLGSLSTFENVAKYNVAGPISGVIAAVPFSFSMFLLTREAEVKDERLSKSILKRVLRISFSLSLLFAILILSFIFPIVEIFFPKYIGVEVYIMILAIGILFSSIYSMIIVYNMSKLQPEKIFWPIVLAALINLGLDVLLIPKYGLYGITAATTIAHTFAFFTIFYKEGMLKEFISVLVVLLFVPLSYYAGALGVLLVPLALAFLYSLNLLKEGDIYSMVKTVFEVFERFK
ncbi:MAG: hypothetical protein Q8P57_01785 [Candidatus Pacearchaeota archaeon]|nr:hypothetical protein [Candidatus Pacearchaeota archaeon]